LLDELRDLDFKAVPQSKPLVAFGSTPATARTIIFGIVNTREGNTPITASAASLGAENERKIAKASPPTPIKCRSTYEAVSRCDPPPAIQVCALARARAPQLRFTSFVVNYCSKFMLHVGVS
jgi:hypothetical protein